MDGNKKLLWIVLSVGVLLVILIGLGILLFNVNRGPTQPVAATPGATATGTSQATPGTTSPSSGIDSFTDPSFQKPDGTVATGPNPLDLIPPPTLPATDPAAIKPSYDPKTGKPLATDSSGTASGGTSPGTSAGTAATKPAAAKPAATKPATAASKPAATKPAAATPKVQWWIQAGSYRSRTAAEDAQATLKKSSLVATIATKEVGGITYFRVRIGPYPSESEASHWLDEVRKIAGMADSFVTKVTS